MLHYLKLAKTVTKNQYLPTQSAVTALGEFRSLFPVLNETFKQDRKENYLNYKNNKNLVDFCF